MNPDIALAALKALNEVLTINGLPEVPVNHDIHARIGFWIARSTRRTGLRTVPASPMVRLDHARQVLQMQTDGAYFFRAKNEHWEVVGFDDFGTLHAYSLQRGTSNQVEQFDFRTRLTPVTAKDMHTHLMQITPKTLAALERQRRGLSTAAELIARNS